MKQMFAICLFLLGVILVSGCATPEGEPKVIGEVEFQIQNAEYEAGKIIITLSTNASVENARIDIVDEANQLLCTRYKDLIAGVTEIEMTDCKTKEKITVSVSPPGGGIVTRDFTLAVPTPKVEIINAEYMLGAKLILRLDANVDIENTRIEILDEDGTVLCTEYVDLSEGLNEIEPRGCGTETKITVSATPPGGVMTTEDLTLELALLELEEGYKYVYKTANCPTCTKRDSAIYVTNETGGYWEGIAGIKIDKKAYLMRWMIGKDDLNMLITLPLTEEALLGEVDYIDDVNQMTQIGESGNSLLPFWMIVFKEIYGLDIDELITTGTTTMAVEPQSVTFSTSDPALYGNYLAYTLDIEVYQDDTQTEIAEFVISAAKPYLMMEINLESGPQTSFKRVEQKEFSVSDYAGYSIEEWTPPPPPEGEKEK